MAAAVNKFWVAAVVIACALPSAAANVFPRLTGIWNGTAATSGDIAMVATLTMTALLMAACPFAVGNARNIVEKLVFLGFGIGLAGFNLAMAHDTIGKARDSSAAPVRQLHAQTAALKSRIDRAQTAATQLPQLPQTSAAEVSAADQAVQLAEQAKAQECGKVGDNCRLRVYDLNAAIEKRAKVLAARAVTEKRETIEAEQASAQQALDAIGYVPDHADKSASRLAKDIGHWVDLGPDPELPWSTG